MLYSMRVKSRTNASSIKIKVLILMYFFNNGLYDFSTYTATNSLNNKKIIMRQRNKINNSNYGKIFDTVSSK